MSRKLHISSLTLILSSFLLVVLIIVSYIAWPYLSVFINPKPASLVASNAYLIAKDLTITVDGEEYGLGRDVHLSTPIDFLNENTTLEAIWKNNNKEKRLFIYFSKSNDIWNIDKISVYDNSEDWVHFEGFRGEQYRQEKQGLFMLLKSNDKRAIIRLFDYKLQPFTAVLPPIESSGYLLQNSLQSEVLSMKYEPSMNSGYGVGVVLRDRNGNIVKDQRDIKMKLEIADSNIVGEDLLFKLFDPPKSVNDCSYDILYPCPQTRFDLKAKQIGETRATIRAINKSSGEILATTSFRVVVTK